MRPLRRVASALAILCISVLLGGVGPAFTDAEPSTRHELLSPLPPPAPPDLAPYMGDLARLTHKLALAVDARNLSLSKFFAYEVATQLEKIQRDVPIYAGHPIGVLADRHTLPALERLTDLLTGSEETFPANAEPAFAAVLASCNACHRATQHGFIRIVSGTDRNPFNLDFAPAD